MAEVSELPHEAQEVLSKVLTDYKSVFKLVDDLGWTQTEVQRWVTALDAAGWLDSKVHPDANPSGGAATVYRKKRPEAAV